MAQVAGRQHALIRPKIDVFGRYRDPKVRFRERRRGNPPLAMTGKAGLRRRSGLPRQTISEAATGMTGFRFYGLGLNRESRA
jgi:hypothetical protein